MKRNIFRITALLTLSAMILGACGTENPENPSDTTLNTEPAVTADNYEYADIDWGGDEFRILNTSQTYGFYQTLDLEEATGDSLDDAIFERNSAIEEKFNINITVDESYELDKSVTALSTAVMAGDDLYHTAFLRASNMSPLITQEMLVDLQYVESFNFDEPWWDSATNDEMRLGKNQNMYCMFTDFSLVDFEGTMVIFFNEDMLADLGMDMPYDAVREGKWTLDLMNKYQNAAVNLNGADSFAWDASNAAVYGMTGHTANPIIFGTGATFFTKNEDNYPEIAVAKEINVNKIQKVLEMFDKEGEYLYIANSGNDHYEMALKNGKCLMITGELKAANKYRDMEASYGIVPCPKYDEEQERYYNYRSYSYPMSIPVTNKKLEDTAAILDALSYLTYRDVMDDFYDGKLSNKSLRNDDSVEMLEIIRETRVFDFGLIYGWNATYMNLFRVCIQQHTTEFMSSVESVRESVEASIDEVMTLIDG